MKKLFLFSIFMIFVLLGLQAQNFKAGLLAGAVPSQVDGDNMSGFNKIGWTAGAYLSLEHGENLVLFDADCAHAKEETMRTLTV